VEDEMGLWAAVEGRGADGGKEKKEKKRKKKRQAFEEECSVPSLH
jgi:hypothetical protein